MHNRPRKRLNMYAVAMRLSMRGEYGGFHKRPLGVEFLELRKIYVRQRRRSQGNLVVTMIAG
jgi:hypothetical protein